MPNPILDRQAKYVSMGKIIVPLLFSLQLGKLVNHAHLHTSHNTKPQDNGKALLSTARSSDSLSSFATSWFSKAIGYRVATSGDRNIRSD